MGRRVRWVGTVSGHPVFTVAGGDICRDGVPVFVLVRKTWGDGAPTHRDLDHWSSEIAAALGGANPSETPGDLPPPMDDATNWPGMTNARLADELAEVQEAISNGATLTPRMLDALDEAQTRISEYPDEEDEESNDDN